MGNGKGWDFYLFVVAFGSIAFLGVAVTFGRWLWRHFRKPPASFPLPAIPPGGYPLDFATKLRDLADYVDGLPAAPEKQKRSLFMKARAEQEKHHYSTAIELFRDCLGLELSAKEKAVLHLQIGNSYSRLGEPGHALAAYQLALSNARQCEEMEAEGAVLNNIGLVYANKGELDKALTHYQQALDIDRKIGNPLGEANALGNMGFALVQKRKHPAARKCFRASYELYLKLGASPGSLAKVKKALDELGEE